MLLREDYRSLVDEPWAVSFFESIRCLFSFPCYLLRGLRTSRLLLWHYPVARYLNLLRSFARAGHCTRGLCRRLP